MLMQILNWIAEHERVATGIGFFILFALYIIGEAIATVAKLIINRS